MASSSGRPSGFDTVRWRLLRPQSVHSRVGRLESRALRLLRRPYSSHDTVPCHRARAAIYLALRDLLRAARWIQEAVTLVETLVTWTRNGLTTACSGRSCAPPLMLSVRHSNRRLRSPLDCGYLAWNVIALPHYIGGTSHEHRFGHRRGRNGHPSPT